jgi:hypothetical protein
MVRYLHVLKLRESQNLYFQLQNAAAGHQHPATPAGQLIVHASARIEQHARQAGDRDAGQEQARTCI